MPAIITSKFRIHNAQQFVEGFGEAAATNVYLGIGRPYPWADEKVPDSPVDTIEQEYKYWDDMLALKRCQSNDVTLAVVRRNWTTGKYYDIYRHNYDGSSGQGVQIDSGSLVSRASLFDASFFVITDEYNVYKCLDNRNSLNEIVPSTVKPTGRTTSPITTADGYTWKYMYTVSPADVIKFASTDFIPVKEITSNPGTSDAYIDQWNVRAAAVDGSIEKIVITNAGAGFVTAPSVLIIGDGSGATAQAVIDAGSGEIVNINMTNIGSGYTYATVTVAGGSGVGAQGSAIISPRGGHGFNPIEELGGFYAMMNVRLEYDDGSGDFPVVNDYRRIMIVRDPYNYATTTVATASTMKATREVIVDVLSQEDFAEDEIITGASSGAVGRIIDLSYNDITSATTIRYIQLRAENAGGQEFTSGETIEGSTSGAIGTTGVLVNPEVQPFSGDVIYVENRRQINRAADQIEDIKIIVEM